MKLSIIKHQCSLWFELWIMVTTYVWINDLEEQRITSIQAFFIGGTNWWFCILNLRNSNELSTKHDICTSSIALSTMINVGNDICTSSIAARLSKFALVTTYSTVVLVSQNIPAMFLATINYQAVICVFNVQ